MTIGKYDGSGWFRAASQHRFIHHLTLKSLWNMNRLPICIFVKTFWYKICSNDFCLSSLNSIDHRFFLSVSVVQINILFLIRRYLVESIKCNISWLSNHIIGAIFFASLIDNRYFSSSQTTNLSRYQTIVCLIYRPITTAHFVKQTTWRTYLAINNCMKFDHLCNMTIIWKTNKTLEWVFSP